MKAKTLFLILPFLFLLAIPALASDYADGYVEDNYTYRASDGYWYSSGIPYTRQKVTYTKNTYYYCGRYYPQEYYYYTYTRYYPPVVTSADPEWRSKLLDIAAYRDKVEGKVRLAANEHNMFLEAVGALGLGGNFNWQGYGKQISLANPYHGSYGYGNNLQLGNYGANGNSLYGYSYSSLSEAYGATDTNVLYQQAAALAKNSQDLGGQATDRFSTLVQQAGNNKARVAEILAKGQAATTTLQAASAAASTTTVVQSSGTGVTTGTDTPDVQPQQPLTLDARRQAVAGHCIACHSGPNPQNGYDVAKHWQQTPQQMLAVVERLLLDPSDPRHMPRGPNGRPGIKLPANQIMEFMPLHMTKVP